MGLVPNINEEENLPIPPGREATTDPKTVFRIPVDEERDENGLPLNEAVISKEELMEMTATEKAAMEVRSEEPTTPIRPATGPFPQKERFRG